MTVMPSENLRGDISGRSTIGHGLLIDLLEPFREPEVDQFQMAALRHRYHDVLRLQVSINNVMRVQILERKKDLSCIVGHIALHCGVVLTDLG